MNDNELLLYIIYPILLCSPKKSIVPNQAVIMTGIWVNVPICIDVYTGCYLSRVKQYEGNGMDNFVNEIWIEIIYECFDNIITSLYIHGSVVVVVVDVGV